MATSLLGHYKKLAASFNTFFAIDTTARAQFIQRFLPLTKNDQLLDIGGGTGHISLMVHSNLGMTSPVVVIDPVQELLDVAKKNGALTIRATAEEFLASKPDYKLKVSLMNGCVHHLTDRDFYFTRLAKYMPNDGMCFITGYENAKTLPLFKLAEDTFVNTVDRQLCDFIRSKGLFCQMVRGGQPIEVDKKLWNEAIRNRFLSLMENFSDEQLEQGIKELEVKYRGQDVLKFDMTYKGIIVTKTPQQ